jgi:hypothetical protein
MDVILELKVCGLVGFPNAENQLIVSIDWLSQNC